MADEFRIELDLGGGLIVPFTLSEDDLKAHRNPVIRGLATEGDRRSLRSAAAAVLERAVTKNLEDPLKVVADGVFWVIPTRSVRAGRLIDPSLVDEPRSLGFDASRLGE